MYSDLSIIPLILLVILMIYNITKGLLSKERCDKYSPVIFYAMYLFYYIVMPYFDDNRTYIGVSSKTGVVYLVLGAFLSYLSFVIGFKALAGIKPTIFNHFNSYISYSNARRLGFIVLFIGFFAWGLGNGFNLEMSFTNEEVGEYYKITKERGNTGYTEVYLTALKSLMTVGACILYASSVRRKGDYWYLLAILISVMVAVQGGFRGDIAKAIIVFAVFYQNFPFTKKINFKVWLPIFIVFWISLGVIERSRIYGHGLNFDKILEMTEEGTLSEKSSESASVFNASAIVMEHYAESGDRVYLWPVINAALMPLPRALFPWKPAGQYGGDVFYRIWGGNIGGIAYMSIVESFMAFGWFGVVLYAMLMGMLARLFWNNFLYNRKSIVAIIMMASFNAILYVFTSRGYMAAQFVNYMYNIIIPFWIVWALQKIFPGLRNKATLVKK